MARSSSRKKNKTNSTAKESSTLDTNDDLQASEKQHSSDSIGDEIGSIEKQSLSIPDEGTDTGDTNACDSCSPVNSQAPDHSPQSSKSPTATTDTKKNADERSTAVVTEVIPNIKSPDDAESDPTTIPVQDDAEQAESPQEDNTEEDEDEEQWELNHVFTIEELCRAEPPPQNCMSKKCPLFACVSYVSSIDKEYIWHSCIDCQEKDYGGWPENINEIPIKFMTKEHRMIMIEKCTGQYAPAMPNIPIDEHGNFEEPCVEETKADVNTACLTDDANHDTSSKNDNAHAASSSSDSSVEQLDEAKTKANSSPLPSSLNTKEKNTKSLVTPSPVPLATKSKGLSKAAIANHEKWRNECLKLGGTGKICVKKPEIKKMIFDLCKDRFAPMNITQIYHELKGCVPSVLLKSCLGDMALDTFSPETQFAESDDDDGAGTSDNKKPNIGSSMDEYSGSMILKGGRNANTCLYYVDYSKLFNNGNGMLAEDRNELLSSHEKAKHDLRALELDVKQMNDETNRLLSEPINLELNSALDMLEADVSDLQEKVTASRGLKSNEKLRKTLMKKIDSMAAQWRKRKRITMEFLVMMEDVTEGTVCVKKCMNGDGQMDIDSDEAVVKGQIQFLEQKRQRGAMLNSCREGRSQKKQKLFTSDVTNGFEGDENFVGVELTSRGVKRIYIDDK